MPSHITRSRTTRFALWIPVLIAAATASCRDLPTAAQDTRADINLSRQPVTASAVNLAGRALAANCFQCHGTNGVAGELKIAGESASEIISELNEMRTKDPRRNIMNLHALAYTPAEIALIGEYFSKQGN